MVGRKNRTSKDGKEIGIRTIQHYRNALVDLYRKVVIKIDAQKAEGCNSNPAPKEDKLMKEYFEMLAKKTDEVFTKLK